MARSNTARRGGDDLQAMLFIIESCRLLHDHEHVEEVGFEVNDAKGFDDIMVSYSEPIPDGCGDYYNIDYIQVKYHVLPGKHVTGERLIDPKFIGAKTESLLQKAQRLQQRHAPDGKGCRLILRQPNPIADGDPLSELLDQSAGYLRFYTLFSQTAPSKVKKLRQSWCEHLNVDNKGLELALKPLRIQIISETLEQTRLRLNRDVQAAGFKPVDLSLRSNPYLQIPWILAAERTEVVLNRERFTELMKQDGLYLGPPLNNIAIRRLGLKSFPLYSNYIENNTDSYYSFVELFDGKHIRDPDQWNSQIYPKVVSFFESEISAGDNIWLNLECHHSIVYAAGYASARCGAKVWPEQLGEQWIVSDQPSRPFPKLWDITNHQLQKGEDIAVAVSASQNVSEDVKRSIEERDLPIGLLIEATVCPNVSSLAVKGADHAFLLAQDLMQHVQKVSAENGRRGCIHFFVSVPKALMFFMGREGRTLPRVQLYEYNGNYTQSILIE